jgi:hypothetical protein
MIKLGALYVVPIINLLHEVMMTHPLIHCDETRLQVLKSDKAPKADHWMWVRASGPPGRRIILFDYDASRAGAVPKRLLDDYRGILLTDGYEAYEAVARTLSLAHAGCFAHYPESVVIWSVRKERLCFRCPRRFLVQIRRRCNPPRHCRVVASDGHAFRGLLETPDAALGLRSISIERSEVHLAG